MVIWKLGVEEAGRDWAVVLELLRDGFRLIVQEPEVGGEDWDSLHLAVVRKGDSAGDVRECLAWGKAYRAFCVLNGLGLDDDEAERFFLQRLDGERVHPDQTRWAFEVVRRIRVWVSLNASVGLSGAGIRSEGVGWDCLGQERNSRGLGGLIFYEQWKASKQNLEAELVVRHYSRTTLKSYVHWLQVFGNYLEFPEVKKIRSEWVQDFLLDLAQNKKVASATQSQARNALLFVCRFVWKLSVIDFGGGPRAKPGTNVADVLTQAEVVRVFARLPPELGGFFRLLYGCGLRLGEAVSLRVQDFDLEAGLVTVHRGKGEKSRSIPLPKVLLPQLKLQFEKSRRIYDKDVQEGFLGVFFPEALERKYSAAPREWAWFWVFPGLRRTKVEGGERRYHLHETIVQKVLKKAVIEAGLSKHASVHTFRHSFATHSLLMGTDIRTLQDLMGHSDVKTTMIYTQSARRLAKHTVNPLDALGS